MVREQPENGIAGVAKLVESGQDNVNPNASSSMKFLVGRVCEYVFVSKRVDRANGRIPSKNSSKLVRWGAYASIVAGFGFAAVTAAGHIAGGNVKQANAAPQTVWRASLTPALGSGGGASQTAQYLFDRTTAFQIEPRTSVIIADGSEKVAPVAAEDPFESVVKKAKLSPEKLRKAFKRPEPVTVAAVKTEHKVAYVAPKMERFGASTPPSKASEAIVLAYAGPDQSPAAQALHALAQEEAQTAEDMANAMPETAPIPLARPGLARAVLKDTEEPAEDDIRVVNPTEREPSVVRRADTPPPGLHDKTRKRIVTARRDEPAAEKLNGGLGWSFRGMFGGGARAGKGVAVYDISAKKVYMPDGTVLSAFSGMGKMANNPKYTHVKMNGPTPVHTYNLKMREKRFHGVEAIRMLPVDGKNKFGRDGFLTHSQLVRGQQSHGCVAFPDYNKFLNAFKKGKVKQMVVVSSGGRAAATRMAAN